MTETSPRSARPSRHPGGPLLVARGAGHGQDARPRRALRVAGRRTGRRRRRSSPSTFSAAAADRPARADRGARAARPTRSCRSRPSTAFCARLLRDEALEAGVDPFAAPVTPADRLAMLLERIDELPLASHDLRGNPSALLGSIVQRIDRLKDELVTAGGLRGVGGDAARGGGARPRARAREREFAAIYAAHDRMLAEAGTLDFGDLVLHAFRLLRERPHVRARLAARFRTCSSTTSRTRASPRACCCGCSSPSTPTYCRGRRRPGDPPLPRRLDEEHRRLPRRVAGRRGRAARRERTARRERILAAAQAVVAPDEAGCPSACGGAGAPAARSRSGAAPTSAPRRRPSPPTSSG